MHSSHLNKSEIQISKFETNPKFKFQKSKQFSSVWIIRILNIRACFEFRLPARSRFGEGRDFVLRIFIKMCQNTPSLLGG